MQESSVWREEGPPDATDFSHEERAGRFIFQVSAEIELHHGSYFSVRSDLVYWFPVRYISLLLTFSVGSGRLEQ